jgi:hypothetical protein
VSAAQADDGTDSAAPRLIKRPNANRPGPVNATISSAQQNNAAASPPFSIGQRGRAAGAR